MAEKELFTLEDGSALIKFARENIEYYLENNKRIVVPEDLKERFSEKAK